MLLLRSPFLVARLCLVSRVVKFLHYHLTLKMASAQVVETSVNNNSPSQDSNHPDDLFQWRNLFSCVRFLKCLACLHQCNETGKLVFATDSKYAVCFDEKRMEKVFLRFCGFIIMFKFAYVR